MNIETIWQFFQQYFSYDSYVTLGYFFLCFFIFLLNFITKDQVTKFLKIRRGSIFNPMNYVRLFTSGLCHTNFQHFKNNFVFILLLGPILEERYGSIVLLEMILITTVASSVFHLFFYESSAIGASDVVYMMVVLCGITCAPDHLIPVTFVFLCLFFVLSEVIGMFFHKKKDNTGYDGHVIGAICGFLFGYVFF